ncbi:MAG: family 78 glycoside hydrolase catalytic domain [Ilumatobacteraceae bacterium]
MKHAAWIEPIEQLDPPKVCQRPAHHLTTEFSVAEPVVSATVRATAHGLYELFVNGTRVGDEELLPGFTSYRHRLQVHSFDVTDVLVDGANAFGALLSDGWWRGQHSSARRTDSYGSTTAFLAELHMTLVSGEHVVVATDGTWRSTPSHVLAADMIAGEVHDLARRVAGWASAGTDRSGWDPVRVVDHGVDTLVEASGPATRRVEELAPVTIREIAPGRHVVDFGQNSNGWVRLTDLGPTGTTLTITHGERLDETGDVDQRNVSHADKFPDRPFQTDVVVSAGDGTTFEPRHSTKGFRYVRVDGHPGPLDPASITSIVVHSDLRPVGEFSCSDDRINRLHDDAVWSFRGNACGIPTDCPQRERAGWTGDWQVFVETAAYLYDVTDFSARWLLDLAAEQRADGAVSNVIPDPHDFTLAENAIWAGAQGSAGWGDAACHVPWELYLATGRTDVAHAQFDSMRRWVDYAAERAAAGRHPERVAARPEPLPHEQFIWDSGFHFGEWTEPSDEDPAARFGRVLTMDHGPTATAFLHRSALELSHLADAVGESELAQHYAALADAVRTAWQTEFIHDGHVQPRTQANLVRALAFGLLPDELAQSTADDLVRMIRDADTHLGTGFLATPFLLPVLADHGHLDVAYELLFQDSAPSWLYMIDHGATTIWEQWEGLDSNGEGSLNHYSKGAVISFLHRYVAGLQIVEPGYRAFRVAPRPGGGITRASTWHDSPFGRIDVAWHIEGAEGHLSVTVPAGTVARVEVPDGTTHLANAGIHGYVWSLGA